MKTVLLVLCLMLVSTLVCAGANAAPPGSGSLTGEVLEVTDVESYTYLRLKVKDGETWVAVSTAPVKKGDHVTIENTMVMNNFRSKSLKKTFKTIVFGNLGGSGATGYDMAAAHAVKVADIGDVHVARATGENARSVEEINSKAAELKDKPVLLRGKIVKYNPGIMGKNWLHLRDGSGTEANKTNDILVTTTSQAKLGDVVVAKGVIRTGKDFGAGYAYKVLVEDAVLQP